MEGYKTISSRYGMCFGQDRNCGVPNRMDDGRSTCLHRCFSCYGGVDKIPDCADLLGTHLH